MVLGIHPKADGLGHLLAETIHPNWEGNNGSSSARSVPSGNIQVWVRKHLPGLMDSAVILTEECKEADFPRKGGQPYRGLEHGRQTRDPQQEGKSDGDTPKGIACIWTVVW
ncbi:hypothetical protein KIL84_022365 [Mauremys mutica]|uniref:Uncharacterized protein n=1 Tax=Mauremys mutica TaxID=74926 RepID=A0A9D3XAV3_9SAUR|nr:hypothetical protein KIL84_022365 [Mauremys mutica]